MKKLINDLKIWQFLLLALFMIPFMYLGYTQDVEQKKKLKECHFFTIAYPIRMPDSHLLYFYFYKKGKKIESTTSVGSQDVGFFYTKEDILSKRYLVEIYCNDYNIEDFKWDIKVPDTLQYIPANGWDRIPYGLDKVK